MGLPQHFILTNTFVCQFPLIRCKPLLPAISFDPLQAFACCNPVLMTNDDEVAVFVSKNKIPKFSDAVAVFSAQNMDVVAACLPKPSPPLGPPPAWSHRFTRVTIIDVVLEHVADTTGLRTAASIGWTHQSICDWCKRFELQMKTEITDDHFWQTHPWRGLYSCLRDRLMCNMSRCTKKTHVFRYIVQPPFGTTSLSAHALAMNEHLLVPCMVWSSGTSKMESSSQLGTAGVGGDDASCCWWPMLVNPWRPAWNGMTKRWDDNTAWGLCPALGVNGGRPWPVHRTRLAILSGHLTIEDRKAD